jgi:hypothetical protein
MEDTDKARILIAVAEQGTRRPGTPSEAILELLTEFAGEDKFEEISYGYRTFAAAYPPNAIFVRGRIPAKMLNIVFARHSGFSLEKFDRWENSAAGRDWQDRLEGAASNPTAFSNMVRTMRDEIAGS